MDTAAGSDASNKAGPVEGESLNWISLAGLVDRWKPETGFVLSHDVLYIIPAADVFSNAFLTINTFICKTGSNFERVSRIHVSYKF